MSQPGKNYNDRNKEIGLGGSRMGKRGRPAMPELIDILFILFAIYMVLPFIEVPVFGLSLSAPIFLIITIISLFKPPHAWHKQHHKWIFVGALIGLGVFLSMAIVGIKSYGVIFERGDVVTIIQYLYWLVVFVVTAYYFSQKEKLAHVSRILSWSIFVLALLRWAEMIIWNRIGPSPPRFLSQNAYGFLFSTFSPFLFVLLLQEKGKNKLFIRIIENLALWSAIAINGSRSSWIALILGLLLSFFLLITIRKGKSLRLLIAILLLVGILATLWVAFPKVADTVEDRLTTFQALEEDKATLIRELMIQKALRLFRESPLTGVGAGRFTASSIDLLIPKGLSYNAQEYYDRKSAHNSYLALLAETGILGTLPFLILLLMLIWPGLKTATHYIKEQEFYALAIFMAFFQMSIHLFAVSSLNSTTPWFIYGLNAGMIAVYTKERKRL